MNYSVYHPRLLTSALPVHPIRSFALRSIDGGGNYDGSESELNWRGSSIAVRIHGERFNSLLSNEKLLLTMHYTYLMKKNVVSLLFNQE